MMERKATAIGGRRLASKKDWAGAHSFLLAVLVIILARAAGIQLEMLGIL